MKYHKWKSYVWFLRYRAQLAEFFLILDHFLPFYLKPNYNPENQNFEKKEKNTWRYHYFTQVYHIWQSYDIWFLRYEVLRMEFFVILGHFFYLLSPPNSPKNKNIKKNQKKNHLEISSFNTSGPKIMIICFTDPEI